MDELRERLKQATDALDEAGVPMEAPEAKPALQLVVEAHTELRRMEAAPWWKRGAAKGRLGGILDALQVEVEALVDAPAQDHYDVGPEFVYFLANYAGP